ncbi:MAG: MBL fold metallo-hydrolase [Chloroflexales bacterium]|nr:MBL fold metallo-hydrolase [Chloroflexales bacterium]
MHIDWLHFYARIYPSANMVLLRGRRPVLFDTGFGSDFAATEQLLRDAGVAPDDLTLVVNSHYHGDHSGGNHSFQRRYGLPIAAHAAEARLINARDPRACSAEWLDQPIEAYSIGRALEDGEEIDLGERRLRVVHTPGHSEGHLCLYAPAEGVLLAGDAVHADDVAWINLFTEGAAPLERAEASLRRLAALDVRWMCSGHGPPTANPAAAIAAALARYERWRSDPQRLAWHACKRIFTYHLMLVNGMPRAQVGPYLVGCPWFIAYSSGVFERAPADFVEPFLAELERAGAAAERDGRLVALTPYNPPAPGWPPGPGRVRAWG